MKRQIHLLFLFSALATMVFTTRECKRFTMQREVILRADAVGEITSTSCKVSASVLDLGKSLYPNHGFHWATSLESIQPQDTVNMGAISQTGNLEAMLRNLAPGTRYFVWAYVWDEGMEIKSEPLTFTTLTEIPPTVTTLSPMATGPTTATCGYIVSGDGDAPVTQKGLCFGTQEEPGVEGPHTEDGPGSGEFSGQISGLEPSTSYRIRAYALTSTGLLAYGAIQTFSTPGNALPPSVEITQVLETSATGISLEAAVTSDGGSEITDRGFCWSNTENPDLGDMTASVAGSENPFTLSIGDLQPESHYFVRAFATNAIETAYSPQIEFDTQLADLVDERDGKHYPAVRIGEQVWMARNLDVGTMINGSLSATDNEIIEKYCYQNKTDFCDEYGALYPWEELMQYNFTEGSQGVCPDGWHVPSDEDWKQLEMHLGMSREQADAADWRGSTEGGKLKLPGVEFWDAPNADATNESGFSALPAGGVDNIGVFGGMGFFAHYWTSTRTDTNPWYRYFSADRGDIFRTQGNKDYGTAVRCLRDY